MKAASQDVHHCEVVGDTRDVVHSIYNGTWEPAHCPAEPCLIICRSHIQIHNQRISLQFVCMLKYERMQGLTSESSGLPASPDILRMYVLCLCYRRQTSHKHQDMLAPAVSCDEIHVI